MNAYAVEAYDEAYDEAWDEFDEAFDDESYDEARRRPKVARRPVKTAPRGSTYRPPVQSRGFVTQSQLQQALGRVSQQITTNANAIKTIDGRVRSVGGEQSRMGSALRKEIVDRKKDGDAQRNNLQTLALMPLIFKNNATMGALAGLLMTTDGFGGSSSSGSSGGLFGGNNSAGLLLVAMMAFNNSRAVTK